MSNESRSVTTFLQTTFWSLGVFCLYWEFRVLISALRFGEVDLPAFGKCSQMEAVVFTLCIMWFPLLVLLLTASSFQKHCFHNKGRRPRFPGAMGDNEVPASLRTVTVALFVALALFPTAIHIFLTARAFDHFKIVPSGSIEKALQERALAPSDLILNPFKSAGGAKANADLWWVNAERKEWREKIEPPAVLLETSKEGPKGSGNPSGADNHLRKVTPDKPFQNLSSEEKPTLKGYERVRVSALRWEPLFFLGTSVGLIWGGVLVTINGFALQRRVWLFMRSADT